ncbi:MAG: hypothetical protein V1664_01105 [Candidatus Uhrbacteria bacterium]
MSAGRNKKRTGWKPEELVLELPLEAVNPPEADEHPIPHFCVEGKDIELGEAFKYGVGRDEDHLVCSGPLEQVSDFAGLDKSVGHLGDVLLAGSDLATGESVEFIELLFRHFMTGADEDPRARQLAGVAEVEADADQAPELHKAEPASLDHEVWRLASLRGSGFREQRA